MPQSEYVKAAGVGVEQHFHYAPVLFIGAEACGLVEHGVEQMHSFLALPLDVQKAFANVDLQCELAQCHLRLNAHKIF